MQIARDMINERGGIGGRKIVYLQGDGGNQGLGYLLSFGEGQANTPMVFVAILMLTLVGSTAYLAVVVIEKRVLHYLPAHADGRM